MHGEEDDWGPGEMDGEDEEIDEAEMMKALELNRQLKEMMMRQMQEEEEEEHAPRHAGPRQGGGGRQPARRGGEEPITSVAPHVPAGAPRRPKNNYTLTDDEMNRISRDNNHLLQRMVDIHKSGIKRKGGGFSFNEKYYGESTRHVSSNSINRRKNGDKISRENEALARRLNAVRSSVPAHGATGGGAPRGGGGGGVRSSGYAAARHGVGPLARKNELAARAPRPPRLEQPEMQF